VFINLLVNAAQAVPEGNTDANEIRVKTSTSAEGKAVIEVRDTGCGIPAAQLGRIFDPFFTTKPVGIGTGLGLAICHNIVGALGGEISVESREGAGTCFRIELPAASRRPATALPAPKANKPLVRARILVLDDEPEVANVLRRILCDHEVTVLTQARAALELIGTGKAIDLIFSDLMMPEMSGMDFHAELTRCFPALAQRVVFVSGGAFSPNAAAFLEAVENPRLEKPFQPRSVLALVRRMVPQRR
jgi:CheY-like chemotaxis protein/anti-sigma regulatory factor (Ser/Thr protein kinase)